MKDYGVFSEANIENIDPLYRKFKLIRIKSGLLFQFLFWQFNTTLALPFFSNFTELPENFQIRAISYSVDSDCIEIKIHHENFDIVPAGCVGEHIHINLMEQRLLRVMHDINTSSFIPEDRLIKP